jgi:hypothetical protein
MTSGGGGNCTRVPVSATVFCHYTYGNHNCPWSEIGREGPALRELVATWHRLTPDVRAAIMQLVRC